MSFSEAKTVENPILDWLTSPELNWRFEDQSSVVKHYRENEVEALLLPLLRQNLKDLNPDVITEDARADQILLRLRAERDNAEWLSWMRNEKTHQFASDEQYQRINLIDYDDPEKNDFLATNQFWIEGKNRRRTDILLFINGIPVVNIEAKTTTRQVEQYDWREGAKQTGDYSRDVPRLYSSNAFVCGVNEHRLFYGVPGTKFHAWHQWRDPSPHTSIDDFDEMKCGVFGLFDQGNLLDLIQNFIVFDKDKGETVKKIARYQQFRAANELVNRSLEMAKPRGWRRGIVWHTQGSGKSLTMLFASKKLWNHPTLEQPTVIIVVDRDQLQDQMAGQLYRTNTENCRIAQNRNDLLDLLKEGDGYRGIIVTIMHKFDRYEAFKTQRTNMVMLVDEAHRTQYGDFAMSMRATIPNASLFGFTGTPLELNDRNTPVAFGREIGPDRYEKYMDKYSIADAIRDGATIPIGFEPRVTEWKLWGKELDLKFEKMFAHLSEKERAALKSREAKLELILKLPERIEQIAQDMAEHFAQKIRPNQFKAMLVCYDKETCALYKGALDKVLEPEASICVFSEDPKKDEEIVKQHYLGDSERKKAIGDFIKEKPKDPEELSDPKNRYCRAEMIIVCDMLLTGFDAPIVQAMYLDKGLQNHTLLQAIARVNRPYNEIKKHGLIIDYFGVFENLNEALNYDLDELGEIAFPFSQFRDQFQDEIKALTNLFKEVDRSGTHESMMKALSFLNKNEEACDQFETGFRNVKILYEALQPDEFLIKHEKEYIWLCKLWMAYRKKFYPLERYEISEEDGAKTRVLIQKHIYMEDLKKDFPVYQLDAEYLTKIKDYNPDAKALDIEAMLAAELKISLDNDEDFEPLSEKLKRIIAQKRNGTLAGIRLVEELEKVSIEFVALKEESKRPVRESIAKAALKEALYLLDEESAFDIADAVLLKADELCFENWFSKEEMDTTLYREFTILLVQSFKKYELHKKGKLFIDRTIKLLKKVRFSGIEKGN